MDRVSLKWTWSEGTVDESDEHFGLFYERNTQASALVGRPLGHCFPVQFVSPHPIRRQIEKELYFYITQLKEQDAWAYLVHHCKTAANLYSNVHWHVLPGAIAKRSANS
jgi:hypothetical protein